MLILGWLNLTPQVISLEQLHLRFLPLFKELPINRGNPTKLQELMIERCDLETVPPEI